MASDPALSVSGGCPHPPICVMLKAPRPGLVKTRLAASVGDSLAVDIYRRLVEHQLRMLPFVGETWITYAPAEPAAESEIRSWLSPLAPGAEYLPQPEGDLGDRLCHFLLLAEARGCPGVIFIGSDCPRIDSRVIRKVRAALWPQAFGEAGAGSDVVLIPATDGGYCLLGTKRFEPELFRGITWSTELVHRQTLAAAARSRLTVHEFPEFEDVDDLATWERALAFVPGLREEAAAAGP
jgi:uncharacterized protein